MANIAKKGNFEWIKTGSTFNCLFILADDVIYHSKREREVLVDVWEMEENSGWEAGTWATVARERLKKVKGYYSEKTEE